MDGKTKSQRFAEEWAGRVVVRPKAPGDVRKDSPSYFFKDVNVGRVLGWIEFDKDHPMYPDGHAVLVGVEYVDPSESDPQPSWLPNPQFICQAKGTCVFAWPLKSCVKYEFDIECLYAAPNWRDFFATK